MSPLHDLPEFSFELLLTRFEQSRLRGEHVRIRDYVRDIGDSALDATLFQLFCIEFDILLADGRQPDIQAYLSDFPGHGTTIDRAFRDARSHCDQIFAPMVPLDRLTPLERIGVGGQGEVWLAFDSLLSRLVALKVVKPSQKLSANAVFKLKREGELLAKLSHPNILPLYDLGQELTATGQLDPGSPFLVMKAFGDSRLHTCMQAFHQRSRFAESESLLLALKEFDIQRSDDTKTRLEQCLVSFPFDFQFECDVVLRQLSEEICKRPSEAGSLSKAIRRLHHSTGNSGCSLRAFREMAIRFQRVCDGVAYAHSQGIYHLDLKPDNIILGDCGETLVADWGLAQTDANVDSGVSSIQGTPLYIAPERLTQTVFSGAQADIYSLGAILYCMATGHHAFSETLPKLSTQLEISAADSVVQRVAKGAFHPPSQLWKACPRPLEQIILKAMHRDPDLRYSSVAELNADVGRWLSGDAVTAWREPWTVSVARWMKGHSTQVVAVGAALVTTLLVLSVMLAIVAKQSASLLSALRREEEQTQLVKQAQQLAEFNADKARQQSQVALDTINSIIFDMRSVARSSIGGRAIHAQLLKTVLPQIEKIADEFVDSREQDHATINALIELCSTALEIDSRGILDARVMTQSLGKSQLSNSADVSELAESGALSVRRILSKLREVFLQKMQNETASESLPIDYVLLLKSLGDAAMFMGEVEKAESHFTEALAVAKETLELGTRDSTLVAHEAVLQAKLADAQWRLGKNERATATLESSLHNWLVLKQAEPGTEQYEERLLTAYDRLAGLMLLDGSLAQAKKLLSEVVAQRERLLEKAGEGASPDSRRNLLWSKLSLAEAELAVGQSTAAAKILEQIVPVARNEFEREGNDVENGRLLAIALERWGDHLQRINDTEAALATFQWALELNKLLLTWDPRNSEARRNRVLMHERIAIYLSTIGKSAEALDELRSAIEVIDTLLNADPKNHVFLIHRSRCSQNLGIVLQQLGKYSEAGKEYEQGVATARHLMSLSVRLESQKILAAGLDRLGSLKMSTGDPASAIGLLQESIAIKRLICEARPGEVRSRRELLVSLNTLGDAQVQLAEFAQAKTCYEEALALARENFALDPRVAQYKYELTLALNKMSDVYLAANDESAAIKSSEESLKLARELNEAEKENLTFATNVSVILNLLGRAYSKSERFDEALRCYGEALQESRRIAAADEKNVDRAHDHMFSHYMIGETLLSATRFAEAVDSLNQAAEIASRIVEMTNGNIQNRSEHAFLLQRKAMAENWVTATAEWPAFVSSGACEDLGLLKLRLPHFLKRKDLEEVDLTAQAVFDAQPRSIENMRLALTAWSNCLAICQRDGLNGQVDKLDHFQARLVAALNEAVAHGLPRQTDLFLGEDFSALRSLPEYQALIDQP